MVALGGHAWLLPGGHAWLLQGGVCGCSQGGNAWFYFGGVHGFIQGAGCAWFYSGGMHGFIWGACMVLFGGACMVFSVFFGYNEIRSMSGQYASYWNAFLFELVLTDLEGVTRPLYLGPHEIRCGKYFVKCVCMSAVQLILNHVKVV